MDNFYDIKKINSEIKKLSIPKEYWKINLENFFSHDYTILLSIRQDAGKTTMALLLGLTIYKLYGFNTEYIRNDNAQITQANVETLYDVILKYHYIEKLFPEYNSVVYYFRKHKFYLCARDEYGNIIKEDIKPICIVHSNENCENAKSGYNNPDGNYIVYDEVFDTKQPTFTLWTKLMNNISTIGRVEDPARADKVHVLMLGNNSNQYGWLFDDFCISDLIPQLTFGKVIDFKTEKGTTLTCSLLEQSERHKKILRDNNIHFFGFNTKKAAQFIGQTEWAGKDYQHIDFDLNWDYCSFRRMYIRHRGRYIQLNWFDDPERKSFIFAHFANAPKMEDNVVLCLDPKTIQEFYGMCEYENNKRIYELVRKVFRFRMENRWYYENNYIGELVDDFIKNIA